MTIPKAKTVVYSGGSSSSSKIGFKSNVSTGADKSTHLTGPKSHIKTTTVKTPSKFPGSTVTSSTKSYGGHSSSGKKTGGYSGYSGYTASPSMSPTKAFEFDGIEFWGSAKSKLESFSFAPGDLIVNCLGTPVSFKPFVKSMPEFISTGKFSDEKPGEILLNWPDMQPPPLHVSMEFWRGILESAKENGVKRIFCCCMAGQGRTGTALASFALASRGITHHENAIAFIRHEYSTHAIETSHQQQYLEALVMSDGSMKFDSKEEEDEYHKQFLEEFYGCEDKVDLANFQGRKFSEVIDAIKCRDKNS